MPRVPIERGWAEELFSRESSPEQLYRTLDVLTERRARVESNYHPSPRFYRIWEEEARIEPGATDALLSFRRRGLQEEGWRRVPSDGSLIDPPPLNARASEPSAPTQYVSGMKILADKEKKISEDKYSK